MAGEGDEEEITCGRRKDELLSDKLATCELLSLRVGRKEILVPEIGKLSLFLIGK